MALKYNPRKLKRLSTQTINDNISYFKDIRKLDIPRNCIKYCEKYYLTDNIENEIKGPPYDINEYPYDHAEAFIRLNNDEYLSVMRFDRYQNPWFAFRKTHITRSWYEVDNNGEPLCYYCIHVVSKQPELSGRLIFRYNSCFAVYGTDVIHSVQGLNMWCSRCTTTSLFALSDFAFTVEYHFTDEETKSLKYVHQLP